MNPSYNFELKTILQNTPTADLVAELARRGEPIEISDELPEFIRVGIRDLLNACSFQNEDYELGYMAALDDVLTLRKPEVK